MKNLTLFVLPAILLGACSNTSSSSASEETTITDLIGRNIAINPGSYKRIVCIGAGALRLYSYIGDNNLLCGVEDVDNESSANHPKTFDGVARPYYIANKEYYKTLPSCGVAEFVTKAAEPTKILECEPDLVISEYNDVDKQNALQQQLGVPVVTVSYGTKGVFDEHVQTSLTLLGKILGKESKAETLNKYIDDQKNEISSLTSSITSKKKAYICGLGSWGTTNQYYTAKNYEPFNVAHIDNVADDLAINGVQQIEKEKLESYADEIEVMIIDAAAIKNIKPLYQEDPSLLKSIKAWQNGEVYLQMAYNAYYTNLELSLVNTWYNAYVCYPSVFTNFDIDAKTNEVTKAFLGKELASEIKAYTYSYGGYQKINTETFFLN